MSILKIKGDEHMKKSLITAMSVLLSATAAQAAVQDLIANVKSQNIEAVRQMLDNGEDVNAQNEQGSTALHYAIALDDAEMARLLIENGANLYVANNKGWTPLKIAEKKNVKNVTAVLREMAIKADDVANKKQNEAQTIAAERQLLQRAAAAVEEARDAQKTALAAQEEAETKALILQSKVAMLEKTLAEKSKALEEAEKKADELSKENEKTAAMLNKAEETKKQAAPEVKKEVAPKAPTVKPKKIVPAPKKKAQPKPQPIKVRIPQPSKFHANMTDGADEAVYCLNLLGHGENQHMLRAAEFYAAENGIKQEHYQQIIAYVDEFYNLADDQSLKQRVETCGNVITPKDVTEQNKIIRSLNKALGN